MDSQSSDYDYSSSEEMDYTKLCFEIWVKKLAKKIFSLKFQQAKSDDECTRLLELFGRVVEEWKTFEQKDNLTHITNIEKFQQHVGWNLDNWMDWIELIIMRFLSFLN